MKTTDQKGVECCPKFDPTPWNDSFIEWSNKKFIRDRVCTFMYMPINFGSVMKRLMRMTKNADVSIPEYLCLSDHTSMWNMNVYLAVDKEVPNAFNTQLSGKFYSKVYEGSYNQTGTWTKDFQATISSKGLMMKKMYMWYTTCPKCAKKYGKNYVVIIAEL
jgi:hypothetical protein